jgi:hypothetical protein
MRRIIIAKKKGASDIFSNPDQTRITVAVYYYFLKLEHYGNLRRITLIKIFRFLSISSDCGSVYFQIDRIRSPNRLCKTSIRSNECGTNIGLVPSPARIIYFQYGENMVFGLAGKPRATYCTVPVLILIWGLFIKRYTYSQASHW